jgi:hypothetical protein
MAAMATKSLVVAYANVVAALGTLSLSTMGVALLGIPLVAGIIAGGVASLPSYQGLDSGKTAMIQSGAAIAHSGENITRTEDMRLLNKNAEDKLDRIAHILDDAFGFGGNSTGKVTADKLGSIMRQLKTDS